MAIDVLPRSFWSKVQINPGNSCWEWTGCLNSKGYGCIGLNGKVRLAHRAMLEYLHGEIPPKMVGMHACDNPKCVRPSHLSIGTHQQNMADMRAKGRGKSVVGEQHHNQRVAPSDVIKARQMHAAGIKESEIAKQLGMTAENVWQIVHRRTWSHLPEEAAA